MIYTGIFYFFLLNLYLSRWVPLRPLAYFQGSPDIKTHRYCTKNMTKHRNRARWHYTKIRRNIETENVDNAQNWTKHKNRSQRRQVKYIPPSQGLSSSVSAHSDPILPSPLFQLSKFIRHVFAFLFVSKASSSNPANPADELINLCLWNCFLAASFCCLYTRGPKTDGNVWKGTFFVRTRPRCIHCSKSKQNINAIR